MSVLGPLDEAPERVMNEEEIRREFLAVMQPLLSEGDIANIQSQLLSGGLFLGGAAPCAILVTDIFVYQLFWHSKHMAVKIKVRDSPKT